MKRIIPFNKPYHTELEIPYIQDAFSRDHVSGNGYYTKKCQNFFETKFHFKKCFLTTSCTDALEMAALLLNIEKGDEIIMPSFTFVSTALPFVRQGAIIKFIDSRKDFPGMDENQIEANITKKTKAIVVVHYAGIACDMDLIMEIANRHNLFVIEDAAQCIGSFYKGRPLGGIGHLGCFSFHETKNIHCGEGGLLIVNDESFIIRAEKIWEKGTNRAEYYRNEVHKYEWVDIGSSFLPSDILAALLFAQVEKIEEVQKRRVEIWMRYFNFFSANEVDFKIGIPRFSEYSTNNGHIFWLVLPTFEIRNQLISYLDQVSIQAVFHYQSLHNSSFYRSTTSEIPLLPQAELLSGCLVRLPLYFSMENSEVDYVCNQFAAFFNNNPLIMTNAR
jgi:dTDP-4-amino-4,6-dideoxygalactose transaminase